MNRQFYEPNGQTNAKEPSQMTRRTYENSCKVNNFLFYRLFDSV